jgi:hypothetical protein
MSNDVFITTLELEAGLEHVRESPKERGVLSLIVRRPAIGEREILNEGYLDLEQGLVGDTWKDRGSFRTPDGSPHPDTQLNIMNSRAIALIAQSDDPKRWSPAGDQLFIDLDASVENLPAGTRLAIGSTVIEVTDLPHTGCVKFVSRYGKEAMQFVNSTVGRQLRLRGLNAKIIEPGTIRCGDEVRKL